MMLLGKYMYAYSNRCLYCEYIRLFRNDFFCFAA